MVKLYIDDSLVDIGVEKDLNVKLNRSLLDLQNPESRSGDYSYTIKLPKTKNNNSVFSNINVANVIDKYVKTDDYQYKLVSNGISFEGIFKLTGTDENYYLGVLLSANISWSKLLTGKNLNEIEGWTIPFIGSSASTATNSLQWYIANTTFNNADVAFPLVSYGNFFHSTQTNEINGIYDDSITFEDIPPAPYELKIIKRIFSGIDWNVDSSLFGDPEHQKLVLPFTSSDSYVWNYDNLCNASCSGTTQLSINAGGVYYSADTKGTTTGNKKGLFSYLNYHTEIENERGNLQDFTLHDFFGVLRTRKEYNVPVTTEYDIELTVNDLFYYVNSGVVNNFGAIQFKVGILLFVEPNNQSVVQDILDNVTDYLYNTTNSVSHPNIIAYFDLSQYRWNHYDWFFQPYDNEADIVVNVSGMTYLWANQGGQLAPYISASTINISISGLTLGSTEKVKACYFFQAVEGGGGNDERLDIQECHLSITNSIKGQKDLDIGKGLPAISQLDFIKSWMYQNNLFITADAKNKTVRFDTYDSYFLGNDFGYDITDKVFLNKNEPASKPIDLPKNIYFRYNNDLNGDVLLSQDPDYANLQVTSDSIYTLGDKEIQYLYSSTKYREFTLNSVLNNTGLTISLPSIAGEQSFAVDDLTSIQWSFANSARIIKTNGFIADSSGNTAYVGIDGYQCPILNTIFEDTRENKLNLCNNGDNGLYSTYYERYLSDISESHILTLNSIITGNDFNQMQPNVPVMINNESYITNTISAFDPINRNTTKIELIKRFTN